MNERKKTLQKQHMNGENRMVATKDRTEFYVVDFDVAFLPPAKP